jgi:hypothetical protein
MPILVNGKAVFPRGSRYLSWTKAMGGPQCSTCGRTMVVAHSRLGLPNQHQGLRGEVYFGVGECLEKAGPVIPTLVSLDLFQMGLVAGIPHSGRQGVHFWVGVSDCLACRTVQSSAAVRIGQKSEAVARLLLDGRPPVDIALERPACASEHAPAVQRRSLPSAVLRVR